MAEQKRIDPWEALYLGKSMPDGFQHGEMYLVNVYSGMFGGYAVESASFPGDSIEYFELSELQRNWKLPEGTQEGGDAL